MTNNPPMNQRTERLREIMVSHNLRADDVAQILNRSATTVRIWRCKDQRRTIPELALQVLEFKISGGTNGA